MTWATDEAAPNPWNTALPSMRSFKVEKPSATTDPVGWESENNADLYWNNAAGNTVYTLRFWAKTQGVNTNPATDDERIGVWYRFYSGGTLIAEQLVSVDQSSPSVDWQEYQGALLVPSEPDQVIITAQMGKDATGTVWFDNIDCWTNPWSMGVFGGDAETPEGWMYWTDANKIGTAALVEDPANAHSGTHSALLYENDTQDDEMVFYSEPIPAQAGKWYKISVWAKADSINTGANWYPTYIIPDRDNDRLGITFFFHRAPIYQAWDLTGGDQFVYFDQRTNAFGWTKYTAIAQAPSDAAGVSMRARFTSFPTGYVWYDDFSIQEIVDIITIIEDEPTPTTTLLPTDFQLKQNYPNPFNPETIIEFQVPEHGHVELSIYNMLGQKVRTLVNDVRTPGTYRVLWDGTDDFGNRVATGVYLYQLRGKNALITKKMILVK
ncbi:MAG: T9SS C-terminal target domain-containing protein [Calditrichaeota bacterium]|nr:MAG: T9SS C-terminal target domain-containing protein [Calditrichota bacterium]